MPCLRRHTEGPPGARGARGPGSVRAGAFAAEHLARWALLVGSLCPCPSSSSSCVPSPLPLSRPFLESPFLSRAADHCRSLALPRNLSPGGFHILLPPLALLLLFLLVAAYRISIVFL